MRGRGGARGGGDGGGDDGAGDSVRFSLRKATAQRPLSFGARLAMSAFLSVRASSHPFRWTGWMTDIRCTAVTRVRRLFGRAGHGSPEWIRFVYNSSILSLLEMSRYKLAAVSLAAFLASQAEKADPLPSDPGVRALSDQLG